MKKRGIDISANRTTHLDALRAQRVDLVITLCDRVREVCPEFPSHPDLVHWSVPDPVLESPSGRATDVDDAVGWNRIHFIVGNVVELFQPAGR